MLLEKTTYKDNFPLNIFIAHVKEYPFHYHHDIEFVYVLKGEIWLKNVGQHYLLKEGDIFTNSGHEVHSLTATDKDNVVAVIQVSNRFFTQYFPALLRACFMSYVNDDKNPRIDTLRKMLLQILLDYSRRSLNYQTTCVSQMIEVIDFLNKHFNLFAFDGNVVTNFKDDNPVVVERISRIINYIYTNHASKITLEDLANREHLSTFYISHIIHEYMGISFQELLCFARVEMSEILLLETDRKISVISKDVGFSTTSYYNKYFTKWFGQSPSVYRRLYMSHVLSPARPACLSNLTDNQAINLISRSMSAVNDQEKNPITVNSLHLNVEIDPTVLPQIIKDPLLEIVITQEDYQVMGERIFNLLYELNTTRVILSHCEGDNEATNSLLENRLKLMGYDVSHVSDNGLVCDSSAGYDSIIAAIKLFQSYFISNDNNLHCRLRDQGDPAKVLKGESAILTSCLVPKPSFYANKLLKIIKGNVLSWSKYYCVIKNDDAENPSYIFVTFNYNDSLQYLYQRNAGVYETNDQINSFNDELNIDFTLPVDFGYYAVAKYALSNKDSIFWYMSHLGFKDNFPLTEPWLHLLNTELKSQVNIEKVNSNLNISSSITGAGINVIVVKKVNQVD